MNTPNLETGRVILGLTCPRCDPVRGELSQHRAHHCKADLLSNSEFRSVLIVLILFVSNLGSGG
jgi:hypothetical protein